ncbi:hypothetical protein [Pseudobacteroides cellulosolvens]|uniref:hypothetical protein n=1 Tax=Pseudobacteroides cellulosolvens TaxID=35825 RepID=UPI001A9A55F8|nr:hypothetical protein [Pseudobacteroides cellulosolvens]
MSYTSSGKNERKTKRKVLVILSRICNLQLQFMLAACTDAQRIETTGRMVEGCLWQVTIKKMSLILNLMKAHFLCAATDRLFKE